MYENLFILPYHFVNTSFRYAYVCVCDLTYLEYYINMCNIFICYPLSENTFCLLYLLLNVCSFSILFLMQFLGGYYEKDAKLSAAAWQFTISSLDSLIGPTNFLLSWLPWVCHIPGLKYRKMYRGGQSAGEYLESRIETMANVCK
jgi:hypothetical protein